MREIGRKEAGESRGFPRGEGGAEGQMRLLRARDSAELGEPLTGKQKSGITSNRQRPKPTPWKGNSRGS